MNKKQAINKIIDKFKNKVNKDSKIHNSFLLVHSDQLNIHINIAESNTLKINANQPYHIASIGKLFTAVIIGILYEQGKISYEDYISKYLDKNLLNNIHIYKGINYSMKIKVKHLLNHTSGLHDYFADKPQHGKPMLNNILENPDHFWLPKEVIKWSKDNLKAHFPPGQGFHYSDTGYHILGLIIEKICNKPFGEVLKEYIFIPLKMNDSYLYGYTKPLNSYKTVAGLYAGGINVIDYKSLAIDYAGGGIVSTNEDLLKFMKGLVHHIIIKPATFNIMKDWARFSIGIDYGLMNFYPIPIIFPQKYQMWGNAGSTGSYMFYNPSMDLYLIGSLNQQGYAQKGIRSLFSIMKTIYNIKD